MKKHISVSSYKRYRFPAEILRHCVWVYLRFTLSFRDVDSLYQHSIDDYQLKQYELLGSFWWNFRWVKDANQNKGIGGAATVELLCRP